MLNLFRRHTTKCPHDSREALKCHCPIWIDWTLPTGERLRKPLGLRDWQAAQRRARDMEADGITSVGEAVTVKKAIDDFQKDTKTTIEDTTLKQYRILLTRLNKFCEDHGYVFLKQLDVVQVREFRHSWTTYSPRTAGKHIERLKRFFNWCVENRWLESSPAKPLKNPKVDETDVVPFSEDQVEKILEACHAYKGPNRDRLIVLTLLMLATGLAIGDAAMLSKSKVPKKGSGWYVELRRAKTGTAVSCPIPDELGKAFHALKGETPFWSGKSDLDHLTKNWRKIYTKIFKTAGINGHPHQFRHTAAKRLLVRGLSVAYVATLLGNTEKIVEKHYSKWIPESQQAFDNAIRATWKAESSGTPKAHHAKNSLGSA
jgi:site-specific recombinase XerD